MKINRSVVMILLVLLLSCLLYLLVDTTKPAGAQGLATPTPTATPRIFTTPTPLPAIVQTAQAASARANDAKASLDQAAELEARAAEIRRNAQVQSDQAAQAWSDARAAAAAQNAAAIGEAIGRGEAALDQLRASVNGQGALIATLTAHSEAQAATIISVTGELNQARVDKQTTLNAYTAMVVEQQATKRSDLLGNIVTMFVFIVALAVFFAAIVWIFQHRRPSYTVTDSRPADDYGEPVIDGYAAPMQDIHDTQDNEVNE